MLSWQGSALTRLYNFSLGLIIRGVELMFLQLTLFFMLQIQNMDSGVLGVLSSVLVFLLLIVGTPLYFIIIFLKLNEKRDIIEIETEMAPLVKEFGLS